MNASEGPLALLEVMSIRASGLPSGFCRPLGTQKGPSVLASALRTQHWFILSLRLFSPKISLFLEQASGVAVFLALLTFTTPPSNFAFVKTKANLSPLESHISCRGGFHISLLRGTKSMTRSERVN